MGNITETYSEFFKSNELVLSTYYSIHWCSSGVGEYSKLINISTKIPFKCFVGINKIKERKIIFNNVYIFDNKSCIFNNTTFKEINSKEAELISFLESSNDDFLIKNGYEINILSELQRGHGFGITGVVGSLAILGLYYINGKISDIDFKKEEIINKAWQFESISKKGSTLGRSSYMAFIENDHPIFQSCEIFPKGFSLDSIKELNTQNFNLYEKFNINEDYELPLDYYIIFSGVKSDSIQIANFKSNDIKRLDNLGEFIKNNLFKEKTNFIYNNLIEDKQIYNELNKTISILNLELLYNFYKVLNNGDEEKNIDNFIDSINDLRYANKIIEKGIDFAETFKIKFLKNKRSVKEEIGILPLSSQKVGGGYLIVTKKEISRKTIESTEEEIKTFYPDSYIEYSSSKKQNIEDYGIKVEQDLSKKILSNYINDDNLLVDYGNKKEIIDKNDLNKIKADILVDSIKNKVYVYGNILSSKTIQSQKMLVEILVKLFDSKENTIKNNILSSSTYSSNKNEMSGKIIYPFVNFIENMMGKTFPLLISGKIEDYVIKLEKNSFIIAIISKI